MSFADRIAANNGIAPQETPELPWIEPIPTDNTETLDLAKTYMWGDAQGISTPTDNSWAGVDRESGLTQEELLAQDKANLEAEQLALQDEENNKFAIDQWKLIEDNQKQKKYMQDQEALSLEAKDIQNQNTEIQNEQQITQTQTQLHNLKQNIGFLWQMWQPWVAAAALDAVDRQLYQAGDIFKNLLKQVSNNRAISSIWEKISANQFAKQMQDLQDNLDSQVSKVVQDAFNKIVMLDWDGKLDTMDEVVALKREILASVDTSIEWITMGNIQQRQNAIDHYTQLIEDQQVVIENAQKVNTDMSAIKGYYVDWNWNAIVDVSTWQPIPMPVAPPMEPIFDKESGNLITFSYDENGWIVANVNQVMDVPWKQEPRKRNADTQTYYRTSPDGKFETTTDPNDPNQTNKSEAPSGNSWEDIANFSYDKRGRTNLQCGELVNDYREKVTGSRAWVGDTYATKEQAIRNIWVSDWPVVGGLFAIATGDPAWHIGIVTGINDDWSIEVLDANAAWGNWSEAQHNQYWADLVANMIFSQAPMWSGESSSQYTSAQENMMWGMDSKNLTNMDRKMLTSNGLTETDLYNYKASKRAGKWTEWLEDYEIKRVNAVMDDFDTSQVSTSFAKIQEAYTFADAVSKGENSSDNQWLLYAFAKAMDPDSVVREGEYATIQKYAQVRWDKFWMNVNRVLNGEEFISENAKGNLVNTIKTKYEAGKTNYEKLRSNKVKIINDMAWKDIWDSVLPSMVLDVWTTDQPDNSNYNPVYQQYSWR